MWEILALIGLAVLCIAGLGAGVAILDDVASGKSELYCPEVTIATCGLIIL